ncbi:putative ATP/GTP binding protein [Streptomyces scabiei 87.22]|uniref:Putative ATP/GTP binding protein n=2 Tax=Streptomyces scabiei TaxID=1930 RepID=C9YZ48_STRSW|nr:DUF6716 putative glycosyltransferase [Streptomyces scabiei]MDX2577393.1 hypothetical protein [Streptomyces scabiei]MDX2657122.1 hypothetical protein [Streptomyces scabiei]MDX2720015.1 hypothetical protein [Streptomyces scabiei]MDX2866695.1 hypothetical protein [Streptomyces scabiei]MDX2882947.1 hypothetical protein [Streptomyces scabiei]
MPPRRIAVLADSDTRWKWGASVARQLAPGHALDAYFLSGRSTPTERQLAEIGIVPDTRREVSAAELVGDEELAAADVVVMALLGGTVLTLTHSLGLAWDGRERRPVTVTGYVGVVYEKMVDGLLTRAGSDLVLANSAYDAARFRKAFTSVGVDPDTVVECALPFLGGDPYLPSAAVERPFTLTFAVQPSVPKGRAARLALLERAAAHARLHPGREVLIKLRSMPGEATTHVEADPYQLLVEELADTVPPNLRLVYGNMGEVLDRTDLLVTVSSTAALESMHRGIPTAILTDFGVREAHGNHYFLHSGCLASWDDIDAGALPQPDPAWSGAQGIGKSEPYAAARARIDALRAGAVLPPLRPYYTPQRAGLYLGDLLVRHGLDEQGRPLPGTFAAGDAGRVKAVVRRVARSGAKSLYRVGRQRVAPTLRKWGAA